MIQIKKSAVVSSAVLKSLAANSRCKISERIVIEEGASIFVDPEAQALTIMENVVISRGAHIEVNRGASVTIGRNVTIGRGSTVAAMYSIEIGDGVGIANGVSIRDHNHRTNTTENLQTDEAVPWASGFEVAPIVVERMAILSDDVRVLPGVRVGQNSLVGAGVHLRRPVPPNCRVVGDARTFTILDTFAAPLLPKETREIKVHFFGDSLIDRPSIVVPDPHYDLPPIDELVPILAHEVAGFFKIILQRLRATHPEHRFVFQSFANGGSNIRDVQKQVQTAHVLGSYCDVSFIGVGVNDIWRKYQGRDEEAVGLDEFTKRYSETIELLKERSRLVFCMGEPPVSLGDLSTYINSDLEAYNRVIKQLTTKFERNSVQFIDLFVPFQRASNLMEAYNPSESLWIDGVHLSQIGNVLAADLIVDCLDDEKNLTRLYRLQSYERDEAVKRYGPPFATKGTK